ncbi:MAG: metallophosphoesterase [Oscillospiraceae bacterium]|jgi:3',5'-cyclic AMP phosphodiesterase CpdA|nr:metallophosphoesterase [Oscillospiraceae bacterium]
MKLAVIADPHYYSRALGCAGEAYELRSGSDQKFLAETGDIVQAAFERLAQERPDAVLIAGDLTDNGEALSHEEFRELLRNLQRQVPVYVITATHDWCSDGRNKRYEGGREIFDVATLKSGELRDYYADFGPNQAFSEYTTAIGTSSCAIALSDEVTLLALNDDQNGKGRAGYDTAHLQWILARLAEAKAEGKTVVAMQHHLLCAHIDGLFSNGMRIGDADEIAAALADAGLRYLITGHSHMHDIAAYLSPAGNAIYDINVGSVCGYPAPILLLELADGAARLRTIYLEGFRFAEHAGQMITRVFDGAAMGKDEFIKRVNALGANGTQLAKFYPLIRPALSHLRKISVPRAAKLLCLLTFGKAIRRRELRELPDIPALELALRVFLSSFEGGALLAPGSGAYQAAMAAARAPGCFVKNSLTRRLPTAMDRLLRGNPLMANMRAGETVTLAAPD